MSTHSGAKLVSRRTYEIPERPKIGMVKYIDPIFPKYNPVQLIQSVGRVMRRDPPRIYIDQSILNRHKQGPPAIYSDAKLYIELFPKISGADLEYVALRGHDEIYTPFFLPLTKDIGRTAARILRSASYIKIVAVTDEYLVFWFRFHSISEYQL